MNDGLKAKHRAAIVDILASDDRVERAVLFGSRAAGTHSPASDVDIALFGERLTSSDRARIGAAIEEAAVPQRVDLILHGMIGSEALREHIERRGVERHRRGGASRPQPGIREAPAKTGPCREVGGSVALGSTGGPQRRGKTGGGFAGRARMRWRAVSKRVLRAKAGIASDAP